MTVGERMFGVETEYAVSVYDDQGRCRGPGFGLDAMVDSLRRLAPCLPGRFSNGLFLQTGGRFYIDSGAHPELTTPEVVNPWDICRYILAGDRLLGEVADDMVRRHASIGRVVLTRCNLSYSEVWPGTTWGCHENYAHRAELSDFAEQLIPHLVSRIIYTGAGGFDNRIPGVAFLLSPRAAHITRETSEASTHQRGLVHLKDESLAGGGYRRLHLVCGESLCSHTAMWLKSAITALVVAMIEAGLRPCHRIRLAAPLVALADFNRDPEGTAVAEVAGRRRLTALAMQQHILEQLETHARHPIMPPWAETARCRLAETLDRLARGPAAVARSLDWAIKLALYRQYAARAGFTWETLQSWTAILETLVLTLRDRTPPDTPPPPLGPALLQRGGVLEDQRNNCEPMMEEAGLDWDQLESVLALSAALREIDLRFAQVGPDGIFAALDRSGALDHAVPGVDNIEHAMANPPATGRAKLRGQCVQRLGRDHGAYSCEWTGVWDVVGSRFLDLGNPFEQNERWQELSSPQPDATRFTVPARSSSIVREILGLARRAYQEGAYANVLGWLDRLSLAESLLPERERIEVVRLRAWSLSRLGRTDGTAILDRLAASHLPALWLITDYVSAYRFRGLSPAHGIAEWIRRGEEALRADREQDAERVATFREHQGYWLMCQGQWRRAEAMLAESVAVLEQSRENRRIYCRALATLGEVHRRLGRPDRAADLLEAARREQIAAGYRGDLADFTYTGLARLSNDRGEARRWLAEAFEIQDELGIRMGSTRSRLLLARLAAGEADARRIHHFVSAQRNELPALAGCELLAHVLEHWDAWIGGADDPGGSSDRFWGV